VATISITNISTDVQPLSDFSTSVGVGKSISTSRPASSIGSLTATAKLVAAGKVTISVTPSADEIAAGILTPPQAVQAVDLAPVAANLTIGPAALGRFVIPAGAADVQLIAAGAIPFKMRIYRAKSTSMAGGAGGSTVQLRTRSGGAGTLLATLAGDAVGDVYPDVLLTPAALDGLFARLSDTASNGVIYIEVRPET
jgi:hypothetical protein